MKNFGKRRIKMLTEVKFFNPCGNQFGDDDYQRVGCESEEHKLRCSNCWILKYYECAVDEARKKGEIVYERKTFLG
jgi:hypothetical protein